MKILVVNTGSSSIKYQVFNMENQDVLCSGLVEKIGNSTELGSITHKKNGEKHVIEMPLPSHKEGMDEVVKLLLDGQWGAISDVNEIEGVGHRVVHGGSSSKSEIVTADVVDALRKAIPLAPLHNPAGILGIEVASEIFKNATHVAVFDTSFHQTLPAKAYMYPLPYELHEKLAIRKYGFHGTSHRYVATKAAEIMGKDVSETNVITVHLGNGSSLAAVRNGQSVETSMGMTPLDGLMMGTRCGSIDPAVVGFLVENNNMSVKEVDDLLTKQSGFLGIAGNNDLRNVESRAEQGDERAILSLDMLCHRIKHYIGAYIANLGVMPDAIVFTAGIGENSDIVRGGTLRGLEHLGIKFDEDKNKQRGYSDFMEISTPDSKIKVLVIRTEEELEIAKQTVGLIKN